MNGKVLGIVGLGNMGGAIAKGLASRDVGRILAHDHRESRLTALNEALAAVEEESGAPTGRLLWRESAQALAAEADFILLAIKPYQLEAVVSELRPVLTPDKVLVSIAAAVTQDTLRSYCGEICPVLRIMPNLPVVAGKGVFAFCLDDPRLRVADGALLMEWFSQLGLVKVLPEAKFAAFGAVAGCGPAYACLLMEGMLNAAVALGLSAAEAAQVVAATVEGTAAMALAGEESFADLRSRVCSPGGTTIQAVNHLERTAVRGHITDAVIRAWERDQAMAGGQ